MVIKGSLFKMRKFKFRILFALSASLIVSSCNHHEEKPQDLIYIDINENRFEHLYTVIDTLDGPNRYVIDPNDPNFEVLKEYDLRGGYMIINYKELRDSIIFLSPWESIFPQVEWIPLTGKGYLTWPETLIILGDSIKIEHNG